jgi:SAM-dependent methyltransferase
VDAASEGTIFAPWRRVESLTDCSFYHTMDIPGHGTVDGEWDLRPGIASYFGGLDFAGRQVLEIGPASGFLTFEMERRGADVTSVEVSSDYVWDFVPQAALDLAVIVGERRDLMRKLANGFWFAHGAFGSRARVHYGNAYDLPDALGRFDVAVLACVLLHCRDALVILDNCARVASDAVVVVEPVLSEQTGQPIARLHPSAENGSWDMWWNFTPEFFVQALGVLGFPHATVTHHTQLRLGSTIPMFTVVARRAAGLGPDAGIG